MIQKLLPFLLFVSVLNAQAQDTVYARSPRTSDLTFDQQIKPMLRDCAHGHVCCQTSCSCCTERMRGQYYDTIYHPERNGVQRIVIVERYTLAKEHEHSPVQFRFKNTNGELSRKWYLAELDIEYYYYDAEGWDRYPKSVEDRYREQNAILVTDEVGNFQRIDLDGNVLPMIYQSSIKTNTNVYLSTIIVNNQRFYNFTDSTGTLINPIKYTEVGAFNDQGIAIVKNIHGLQGLVNCSGKEVVAPRYHELDEIGPDRFCVHHMGGFWIINSKGEFITKRPFVRIQPYSEGLAFAQNKHATTNPGLADWVCVDLNGTEVFEITTEWPQSFHDGMAAVFKDRKWGYVDCTGYLVIDYQFDRALGFSGDLAPVIVKNEQGGEDGRFIDRKGRFINRNIYYQMNEFKNGLTRVTCGREGSGIMDTIGNMVIPCQYYMEGYGTKDDWFIYETSIVVQVGKENSLYMINREGTILLDLSRYKGANYQIVANPTQQVLPYLLVYKKDTIRNLIDFSGKEILSRDYSSLTLFNEQLALGKIGKKFYLIDLIHDRHLREFEQCLYYSFQDDLFMIQTDDYPRVYEYYDVHGNKVEVYGG